MDAKRLTPNKIANLVMAEDAWHDSEYVSAEDYDALRAEVERLRADAERYRWLRDDEPDETGLYHNRINEEMPNSRPAYAVRAEADEPVAWLRKNGFRFLEAAEPQNDSELPLYTHPPRREPLTDEAIRDLWSWASTHEAEQTATTQQHAFARAVERAHGIGAPEGLRDIARAALEGKL